MNSIAVCVIIAFFIPAAAGLFVLLAMGRSPHPLVCITEGTLLLWAVTEVCMVPLVAVRASFRGSIPVIATAAALAIFLFVLLSLRRFIAERKKKAEFGADEAAEAGEAQTGRKIADRVFDFIFLIPLIAVVLIVLKGTVSYQHTDADDSRFVVNAVDMVRTDTLFLTNPATGSAMSAPKGELRKDRLAPWAFYMALLSELTGEKASVIAHSCLPCIMILLITCALFTLGRTLFTEERWKVYVFVTVCWLVTLFGYYSVYSAEAFVMGRLWQGKAILAGFGIPVLLDIFFRIYARPDEAAGYICLAIAVPALDLLSSQSIVLTSAAAAFFAIAYAAAHRKPLILIKMGVACIPNVLLLALHVLT